MSAQLDPHQIISREHNPAHRRALFEAYQQIPKAVLEDLAEYIHPDHLSFVAEDPSGRKSAFNEGLRAVWIHIQRRRAEPAHLAPIIKETP